MGTHWEPVSELCLFKLGNQGWGLEEESLKPKPEA